VFIGIFIYPFLNGGKPNCFNDLTHLLFNIELELLDIGDLHISECFLAPAENTVHLVIYLWFFIWVSGVGICFILAIIFKVNLFFLFHLLIILLFIILVAILTYMVWATLFAINKPIIIRSYMVSAVVTYYVFIIF